MHLSAALFSLDEILQEPRLIAPPARVEPGCDWYSGRYHLADASLYAGVPELAAIYRASTLGMAEAVEGGSHLVIVGAAGMGKTVALAHLASLAANLKVSLNTAS